MEVQKHAKAVNIPVKHALAQILVLHAIKLQLRTGS